MRYVAAVVTFVLSMMGTSVFAQEHPEEHPEKKQEQAKRSASTETMTLDELAQAITGYIEQDSKLKGGYFLVYDGAEKTPLMLQLEKVHKDRLSALGGGVYFACTDMKASNGVVYDLDFFMKRTANGIETTEVAVHKKAGQPRYGWKEQNGIWTKVKS